MNRYIFVLILLLIPKLKNIHTDILFLYGRMLRTSTENPGRALDFQVRVDEVRRPQCCAIKIGQTWHYVISSLTMNIIKLHGINTERHEIRRSGPSTMIFTFENWIVKKKTIYASQTPNINEIIQTRKTAILRGILYLYWWKNRTFNGKSYNFFCI